MNKQTYESPEILIVEIMIENNIMSLDPPFGEGGSGDPFPGLDG